MRKRTVMFSVLLTSVIFLSFSISYSAGPGKFPPSVTISVNEGGATLNMIGNAIAAVLGTKLPYKINVRTISGGSNPLIEAGEVQFSAGVSTDSGQAFRGEAQYKGHPMRRLRIAVIGSPLTIGVAVRASSPLKMIQDLRGKKIAGDYKASPTQWWDVRAQLASVGMTWDDVSVVRVATIGEAMRALIEGRVEGANASVNSGITQEANATIKGGIRFLAIDGSPEGAKRMWEAAPGYVPYLMKPGEGIGIAVNTVVVAKDIYIQVGAQVSPDVVYEMSKGIANHLPELEPRYPDFKLWKKEKLAKPDFTIPYHEGAIRYFKEAGLWSPEMEKAQMELMVKAQGN